MLLLPPNKLALLLSLILTLLEIHATSTEASSASTPIRPVVDALEEDHEVRPELTREIMGLFGVVDGAEWRYDARSMVREIGKGLLGNLKSEGRPSEVFTADWREQVGETWAEMVDLKLLEVGHISLSQKAPKPTSDRATTCSTLPRRPLRQA